jgi:hypothetical protein
MRARRLLWLATVLFLINTIMVFVFHHHGVVVAGH